MIFLVSESRVRAEEWIRRNHPEIRPQSPSVVIITSVESVFKRAKGRRFIPGQDVFVWESPPDVRYSDLRHIVGVLGSMDFAFDEGFRNIEDHLLALSGEKL